MSALKYRTARAIADVDRGVILATVDIPAAAERVFRAVTSEEIVRWWGSEDAYRTTRWSGDVRARGGWRHEGIGRDGHPFVVHGEFVEIEPPSRLVLTYHHWEPKGSVTKATWRFEPIPGGTRVVVHHEGFGDARESCASHVDDWEQVLGWLSGYVGNESRIA